MKFLLLVGNHYDGKTGKEYFGGDNIITRRECDVIETDEDLVARFDQGGKLSIDSRKYLKIKDDYVPRGTARNGQDEPMREYVRRVVAVVKAANGLDENVVMVTPPVSFNQ